MGVFNAIPLDPVIPTNNKILAIYFYISIALSLYSIYMYVYMYIRVYICSYIIYSYSYRYSHLVHVTYIVTR